VLELNPHIGNPDHIYPHETLLIPDSLHESVSELTVWQKALRNMPPQLGSHAPMRYEIPVRTIMPGDTIDSLAERAFEDSRYWHVPASVKRAIFLHNNPRLQNRLWAAPPARRKPGQHGPFHAAAP
jgi:hypothetical protein